MEKNVKNFIEFLNEQELHEKINWESIPVVGGWIKARRERKEAEEKAKEEENQKVLDAHNKNMLKYIENDYETYTKAIEKNFAHDPDLIRDKILYLKHFIWAALNEDGWDTAKLKRLHKAGKFDTELKRLMTHATNPRGASFPEYVWFEDLEPDLHGIHRDITFAQGYSKDFI